LNKEKKTEMKSIKKRKKEKKEKKRKGRKKKKNKEKKIGRLLDGKKNAEENKKLRKKPTTS
jgi:hypothetical protein